MNAKIPIKLWLKRILLASVVFFILFSGYVIQVYFTWTNQKEAVIGKLFTYKKQLDNLRSPRPIDDSDSSSQVSIGTVAIPSRVYDKNLKLIGEFFTERRTLINLEKLPPYVTKALIASEDRKFYEHHGFRYSSILRAVIKNVVTFHYSQGGSTLSQQLAKVLFTNQEKTLRRKIYEYFCTRTIEERFTKNQILEMYLNLIYMGHGNFGIESASEYYFNEPSESLSLAEAAMLIGLLPSPEKYSPINGLDKSLQRQKSVLNALIEMRVIDQTLANSTLKHFYRKWHVKTTNNRLSSTIGKFPDRAYRINLAPYFLELVRQELLKTFTADELMKGGLKIYTTLDYNRQKAAEDALEKSINNEKGYFERKYQAAMQRRNTPKAEYYKEAKEKTNGAFLTIEPSNGYILSMIGGSEYSTANQFNRTTMAYRQVGSLLKPFIYYLAISKKKLTPATIVKDEPVKVGNFSFHNYDNGYLGDITAFEALKKSRNTIAVKTLKMVGVRSFQNLLEDLLSKDLSERVPREIGIALGTPSFSPMEMATMYGILVHGGRSVTPRFLLRVDDNQDKNLWTADEPPEEKQIMNPDAAYIVVQMLQSIFDKGGTSGWVSRIRHDDVLNFEIAGKTGTTSDHKDAWFAGLASDEVSIVWIGSDMNAPLGEDTSGGSICSPAWIEYIENVKKDNPPPPFKENYTLSDITTENFCLKSGGVPRKKGSCPDAVENMSFLTGTEPDYFCPIHKP